MCFTSPLSPPDYRHRAHLEHRLLQPSPKPLHDCCYSVETRKATYLPQMLVIIHLEQAPLTCFPLLLPRSSRHLHHLTPPLPAHLLHNPRLPDFFRLLSARGYNTPSNSSCTWRLPCCLQVSLHLGRLRVTRLTSGWSSRRRRATTCAKECPSILSHPCRCSDGTF